MTIRTSIENAGKAMMSALGGATAPVESDILETLKEEHDEVQSLLEKLVDSGNARERKSLVGQIRKALIPHSKAEERVVYNALIALNDKSAKIDGNEGYIEHGLASETLAKLAKLPKPMSPEFSACAKVLRELINHHVREEESNVWAQVREHFSAEDRARMNQEFLAAKKKVKV